MGVYNKKNTFKKCGFCHLCDTDSGVDKTVEISSPFFVVGARQPLGLIGTFKGGWM